MGIHTGLATITKIDALLLDDDDAKKLADAGERILKLYPTLPVTPEALAWGGFMLAAMSVYGPMLLLVRAEVAEKRKARIKPAAANSAPDWASAGVVV